MTDRVALVTGASSGIGAATAGRLLELGFVTYVAARRVDLLDRLVAAGARALSLDVTDDASRRAAVAAILAETGRIDALVNNAGYGSYGAVEDVSPEDVRAQFDVNLFGAAELIRLELPQMRAQRSGTIVNVSSMGGRIYTPFGAWYHATKYGLEALSDCLRIEVAPFGIRVVVIEPGAIRTEWGGIAADRLRATSAGGPYEQPAEATARNLAAGSADKTLLASPPRVVAEAIGKAISSGRPKTRYAIGVGARPLIFARAVLPDRVFDRLIRLVIGSLV